jgi:hypothetical protein
MSLPTLFFIIFALFTLVDVSSFFLNSKESLIKHQYGEVCPSAVANASYVQAMQASFLVIAFYAIWNSANFQKKVVRAMWLWGVLTILFSFVLPAPILPPPDRYPLLPNVQTGVAVAVTLITSYMLWKGFPQDHSPGPGRTFGLVDLMFYLSALWGAVYLAQVMWNPESMFNAFYPSSKQKCFASYGIYATYVTQVAFQMVLDFYAPSFTHQEKRHVLRSLAVLSAWTLFSMWRYWDAIKEQTTYFIILAQHIIYLIVGLLVGVVLH